MVQFLLLHYQTSCHNINKTLKINILNQKKLTFHKILNQKIMKTLKSILLGSALIFISFTSGMAQSEGKLSDAISHATRNGDAIALAAYFNSKIELVLPEKSGVFSKEQAQFLIKDFFDNHPPTSFQIIHEGERENATFAIGRYNYNKGQYRLLFLTKNNGNEIRIHQLRVEKQDE
jgi:hypothetical protein